MKPLPPRWADRLLERFCAPHLLEEIQGDLHERFERRRVLFGERAARRQYAWEVLGFLRPFALKRKKSVTTTTYSMSHDMIQNYFKIAFRNLAKNRVYSFINIFGLSVGMAVAMVIGLWVYDELSFNKQFKNHDRLAKLWQFVQFDVEKSSYDVMPIPLAEELRSKYPDFERVSLSVFREITLAAGEHKFLRKGNYVEPVFMDMLSLDIRAGSAFAAQDVHAILLSESLAKAIFGSKDPIEQLLELEGKESVKVVGVYKDFPANTSFNEVSFLAPWNLYLATDRNAKANVHAWDSNSYQIFAQLKPGADFAQVSAKIKDIRMKLDNPPGYKPEFFLHPMSKWHLFADFKNGVNTGGLISFVWLFGIIGVIVLLLACINFMNLSTARSEKRAKEVGIRKAVGSVRSQLVAQFFSESLLMAVLAFVLALLLTQLALPFFNEVAGKKMPILWFSPWFWLCGLSFSVLTGLIAGSYPALYLSSFQPIKVLKGTLKASRSAASPRRVLVGFQFMVSVTLIIGTIIVFRQIEHAKDRPVGYSREGLMEVKMNTPKLREGYETVRADLLRTGAVEEMAASFGSLTVENDGTVAVFWRGKSPDSSPLLMGNRVSYDFGKTVGWHLVAGRDFSRDFSTDSTAMILNEAAVKLMGFQKPIGERIRWNGKECEVVGVVKDLIKEDPFKPVKPSFFVLEYQYVDVLHVRLDPQVPVSEALAKVEQVFKVHHPAAPFEYKFVDDLYAQKFDYEVRIGKIASVFAGLAILISGLGLFGLASFMAEQRTKEIGIRKVMGASVLAIWQLLSREFVVLLLVAFCVAVPVAYYVLSDWLQKYEYRTELSWWIFAATGLGALLVTLLTVSFQAIKVALMNPVKTLKTE
ncbi:ABC transporter permease [Rhabdobacter roseus]|uniref:Putative permease n=1 Tax=Rhabdobacter roseus TaxID=1655419 RepID=A0A840TDV9_9BACT|nr:ABC transporter permease [Rhabdobacter roseus]MBB5282306.1 putative permease [Rhabdobacter roseus]